MDDFPFIFNDVIKDMNGKYSAQTLKKLSPIDFEDEIILHKYHMFNMLLKESMMFEFDGLPDTIPKRHISVSLPYYGYMCVFEEKGNLYMTWCGLGGELNYNYMPTKAIVANPFLKLSRTFTIDEDCVVIPSDNLYMGLVPINNYFATQMVENDKSINCSLINLRLTELLVGKDQDNVKSLEEVIKARKQGKIKAALDDDALVDGIKTLPVGEHSSNNLIQLLEHRQYVKGSWWNEIGVQSNYNMKRETITSNENILNVDSLLPLCDNMLECREKGFEKVNKMFGTNWKVQFSSSWNKLREDIKNKEKIEENEDSVNIHEEEKNDTEENKNDKENNN